MKNTTDLKGSWEDVKEKLKEKFASIVESDLQLKDGKSEKLIKKIQVKLGKSKAEIQEIIKEF